MNSYKLISKHLIFWAIGILFILGIWFFGHNLYPEKIPEIKKVCLSILNNFKHTHRENLIETAKVAFLGLILSVLFSFLIIFLIGIYGTMEHIISPFIILLKASPAVAFIPVFMIFFGTGIWSKVLVSSMICFFPLVIGGIDGLKRAPKKLVCLANTYTNSKIKILFYVKSGFVLEGFLSGLKTAAPLSVVGAIVGEYVIGGQSTGLGGFIISNTQSYAITSRYVGIVLASLLGLLFYLISYIIHSYYAKHLHLED